MTLPLGRAALARVAPFAVFMALLAARGAWPAGAPVDGRWLYGAGVVAVGALLLFFRRDYGEFARQNAPTARELLLALAAGAAVFMLWIRLDEPWMRIGQPSAEFRPVDAQGDVEWALVAVRAFGAVVLVPLMEELFWRSFLMRWIEAARFEGVDPRRVGPKAIVLSTFVFTLAHTLWLAAAIAGLVYAWLYVRTGRLWVPVVAHAVTNALLAGWVVVFGHWDYW